MAIHSRLTVTGLKEATSRLDDVGLRARRPEPALRSDATLHALQDSERRKFNRGGWRRDTPKWIGQKRRRGLDARTLRATGRLEAALTSGKGRAGITFTAYNATLKWGIRPGRGDLYYAQSLAKGSGHAKVKRRMVVIDKPARGEINAIVGNYIATGVARL
jgi:hypothetical protein